MPVIKITEELDHLQKRVASLKEICKLYPDTIIKRNGFSDSIYTAESINKEVNLIKFGQEKSWTYAYTHKLIGCIDVYSSPEKFAVYLYYPGDIFKKLIIQNYHDAMQKREIPNSLIREVDLRIISLLKERNIGIDQTNLTEVGPDTTIRKLLSLL